MWGPGRAQGKNLPGWEGHVIAPRHRKEFMFIVGGGVFWRKGSQHYLSNHPSGPGTLTCRGVF